MTMWNSLQRPSKLEEKKNAKLTFIEDFLLSAMIRDMEAKYNQNGLKTKKEMSK